MQPTNLSRKRNVDSTRHEIIEAAKLVFTTNGYDQASTRDIAKLAGINVSLIIRYFKSKRNLFELTVVEALHNAIASMEPDVDLPEYLTELLLNKSAITKFDPIIAMLRSASSQEVGPMLSEVVEGSFMIPFSKILSGGDAREKAAMALAIITGYDVLIRMMRVKAHADEDRLALRQRIYKVFCGALT